ncbi:2OG-Fe(II) oxygenase family protein [Candidatus Erwinia dacicola]|uniref:2OG-Fe(II) oxygenase superfamily protein n=1 Tax=Candidatus Erwinia dacicola TaxID=252393 RepID=A0A328TNC4_9GAMM|nr:2OG-Fe(II) oxygenase superfamily protein [Candidatus Erwinia dacicola]
MHTKIPASSVFCYRTVSADFRWKLHLGQWIDAIPLDGAVVVNIGELLELASNGYLCATVHRLVAPPANQERLSIAFILGAQLDAIVPVFILPEILPAWLRARSALPTTRYCATLAGTI